MLSETTSNWMVNEGSDPLNIDAKAAYEDTALIRAGRKGEERIVAELIDAGADPDLRSLDGYSALDLAGNVPTWRLLRLRQKAI